LSTRVDFWVKDSNDKIEIQYTVEDFFYFSFRGIWPGVITCLNYVLLGI
jgi:hypothetical protein